MHLFFDLFFQILPLYFVIGLGYIAGKYLEVQRESIAPLLLYIVVPVVTFKGIIESQINLQTLSYPLYFLGLGVMMSLSFFFIARKVGYSKEKAGMLSLCTSLVNVGYYGLPLVLLVLGKQALGISVLLILGLAIHECSVAYLVAASGKYSFKDSLKKTFTLPILYSSLLALAVNYFHNHHFHNTLKQIPLWIQEDAIFPILNSIEIMMDKFTGAYSLLGMIMIGLGIAKLKRLDLDLGFMSLAYLAKFLIIPALALGFIYMNNNCWKFYDKLATQVIFLMSIVPIGANTITIATQLKLDVDKVAITTVISTLIALVYIPLVLNWININ
jgi:malate permease and related proteins